MEKIIFKNENLKSLFIVLFFGSLWGIIEATLGSILHLPFLDNAGVYACSTTIILPLAFVLMGNCYKKIDKYSSILLMGLIASMIKFSLVLFVGFRQSIYVPSICILLESLSFFVIAKITKPTTLLSIKGLFTLTLSSTLYLFSFIVVRQIQGYEVFTSIEGWKSNGEFYLFTANFVMLVYATISGLLIKAFMLLSKRINVSKNSFNLENIIYSPVFSCLTLCLAFVLTVVLK